MKWRFLDQGGGQVSTFLQLQTAGSAAAQRTGIAVEGPPLLLPLEIAKTVGPVSVNFEAGYYRPWHGPAGCGHFIAIDLSWPEAARIPDAHYIVAVCPQCKTNRLGTRGGRERLQYVRR